MAEKTVVIGTLEVTLGRSGATLRDNRRGGPIFSIPSEQWGEFLAKAKQGNLDPVSDSSPA